jgi:hypothetical protein
LGGELVREGALMGATKHSRDGLTRRALSTMVIPSAAMGLSVALTSPAGATDRQSVGIIATSSNNGAGLVALGGGVLLLGGIGFVIFTRVRRQRKPSECAEQREALELAERAVQYWEAARAHLETVERPRTVVDNAPRDEPAHASLMAKALEGLDTALKQRDERQMDLIRCMASGGLMPIVPSPHSQPFFTPGPDGTSSSSAPNAD